MRSDSLDDKPNNFINSTSVGMEIQSKNVHLFFSSPQIKTGYYIIKIVNGPCEEILTVSLCYIWIPFINHVLSSYMLYLPDKPSLCL